MRYLYIFFFAIAFSCSSDKFSVTKSYVFNPHGFKTGFSLVLLRSVEFDSVGTPLHYQDSLRVDLNYSGTGKVKNKIFFYQKNENYYWTHMLKGRFDTMPINFEKGMWYGLWGDFSDGILKTNIHNFFLYCDSLGNLKVFERIKQTNL